MTYPYLDLISRLTFDELHSDADPIAVVGRIFSKNFPFPSFDSSVLKTLKGFPESMSTSSESDIVKITEFADYDEYLKFFKIQVVKSIQSLHHIDASSGKTFLGEVRAKVKENIPKIVDTHNDDQLDELIIKTYICSNFEYITRALKLQYEKLYRAETNHVLYFTVLFNKLNENILRGPFIDDQIALRRSPDYLQLKEIEAKLSTKEIPAESSATLTDYSRIFDDCDALKLIGIKDKEFIELVQNTAKVFFSLPSTSIVSYGLTGSSASRMSLMTDEELQKQVFPGLDAAGMFSTDIYQGVESIINSSIKLLHRINPESGLSYIEEFFGKVKVGADALEKFEEQIVYAFIDSCLSKLYTEVSNIPDLSDIERAEYEFFAKKLLVDLALPAFNDLIKKAISDKQNERNKHKQDKINDFKERAQRYFNAITNDPLKTIDDSLRDGLVQCHMGLLLEDKATGVSNIHSLIQSTIIDPDLYPDDDSLGYYYHLYETECRTAVFEAFLNDHQTKYHLSTPLSEQKTEFFQSVNANLSRESQKQKQQFLQLADELMQLAQRIDVTNPATRAEDENAKTIVETLAKEIKQIANNAFTGKAPLSTHQFRIVAGKVIDKGNQAISQLKYANVKHTIFESIIEIFVRLLPLYKFKSSYQEVYGKSPISSASASPPAASPAAAPSEVASSTASESPGTETPKTASTPARSPSRAEEGHGSDSEQGPAPDTLDALPTLTKATLEALSKSALEALPKDRRLSSSGSHDGSERLSTASRSSTSQPVLWQVYGVCKAQEMLTDLKKSTASEPSNRPSNRQ